jgi:uncharacterized protein DUF4189
LNAALVTAASAGLPLPVADDCLTSEPVLGHRQPSSEGSCAAATNEMRRQLRAVPGILLILAFLGSAADARDYYGAIAYSKTTRLLGYVFDLDSQDDAESAALISCSDLASDCEPILWFRNACGALAVSSEGAWGSDWGDDEEAAEKKALARCGEYAKDCAIARWVCTTR